MMFPIKLLAMLGVLLGLVSLVGCVPLAQETTAPPSPPRSDSGYQPPAQVIDPGQQGHTEPLLMCATPQPALVVDFEPRTPLPSPEPAPRQPFRDPNFGSCLVRATNRESDLASDRQSPGLKNEYSRVQAFNADGSRFLLYGTQGEWFLYSASSLQPLAELPLASEPRWDAHDPSHIYHTDGTSLMVYNLTTGQNEIVRDFAAVLGGDPLAAVWTAFEGRPSLDSRYWGFMAEDKDWLPVAFLVYDRVEDRVTLRDMRGVPGIEDDVDHVTISPLGNYFLASFDHYCPASQLGDDNHPCGLMVYDRDLSNGRGLLRIVGHYDTALDALGREVVIFQDIDHDQVSMLDLESGQVTPLLDIDFSHSPLGFHFSGLAYDLPGWVLVSTYSGCYPQACTWMDDQLFAVELKEGGRVVRLAHTHSLVDQDVAHDYWAEPHASVNHDFTRILFTSNWGRSGSESVDTYLIELNLLEDTH